MGWSDQNVIARLVIVEGPGEGVFSYSPSPGAGKLVASTGIAAAGTDQFGNAYLAGDTTYYNTGGAGSLSSAIFAVNVSLNEIVFREAATYAGPFSTAPAALAPGLWYLGNTAWLAPSGDTTGNADSALITGQFATPGQTVVLMPGTWYIKAPILVDSRQTLAGSGMGTIIQPGSAWSGSYMIQLAHPATTYQATIQDLLLYGGNPTGSAVIGPGGIQLDNTGWSAPGVGVNSPVDSQHTLSNIMVLNSGGDAYHLDNHIREARISQCKAYRCGGYGFYIGDAGGAGSGCTDSHFTDCTFGFGVNHGFYVLNTNNMFEGCKAFCAGFNFFNGTSGTTQCGFEIAGSQAAINTFVNCSAQQNALHGFDLNGCLYTSVTGCQSDSNGAGTGVVTGVGINVAAAHFCVVTGNVGHQNLTPGNQIWGVQASGDCTGTVIRDNPITGTSGTYTSAATNINRGTATLVAGVVTVPNTSVTAASTILLTTQNPGGTTGAVFISAITPGTSFTIRSTSAGDTGTVAWELVY